MKFSLSLSKKMLLLVNLKWNGFFFEMIFFLIEVVVSVIHVFKHRVWECKAGFRRLMIFAAFAFTHVSSSCMWRGKKLLKLKKYPFFKSPHCKSLFYLRLALSLSIIVQLFLYVLLGAKDALSIVLIVKQTWDNWVHSCNKNLINYGSFAQRETYLPIYDDSAIKTLLVLTVWMIAEGTLIFYFMLVSKDINLWILFFCKIFEFLLKRYYNVGLVIFIVIQYTCQL